MEGKILYKEGKREPENPGDLKVCLEKYTSEAFYELEVIYVLSYLAVTGERDEEGEYVRDYGREIIEGGNSGSRDALAIRFAITKYDILKATYDQKK